LILPVPLLKTGVNVVDVPAVMIEVPGVKEVATGAGITVTVVDEVAVEFATTELNLKTHFK
jgi:hypothetical protein